MRMNLVPTLVLSLLIGGCHSSKPSNHPSKALPLRLVGVPTPPLRVARYDTSGTYPEVRARSMDLRRVNAALRAVVLADQNAYAPYARKEKPTVQYKEHGVYRTAVDRKLLSASTVVVSALLPSTHEVFPGQNGGDGWLAMTVRVPSGAQVTISNLFRNPGPALRVLATAWKARIRHTEGGRCLRIYSSVYSPTVENYRRFALTPRGIVVGSREAGACYRLHATVPYGVLRPYLSKLGAELIAGVRAAA